MSMGMEVLGLSPGGLNGIPAEDPAIPEDMWSDAARKHFGGRIVVARDLMEL